MRLDEIIYENDQLDIFNFWSMDPRFFFLYLHVEIFLT
jgi:hypothetical protein